MASELMAKKGLEDKYRGWFYKDWYVVKEPDRNREAPRGASTILALTGPPGAPNTHAEPGVAAHHAQGASLLHVCCLLCEACLLLMAFPFQPCGLLCSYTGLLHSNRSFHELTPQPIKLKCFSKHFIIGWVFVKQLTSDSNQLKKFVPVLYSRGAPPQPGSFRHAYLRPCLTSCSKTRSSSREGHDEFWFQFVYNGMANLKRGITPLKKIFLNCLLHRWNLPTRVRSMTWVKLSLCSGSFLRSFLISSSVTSVSNQAPVPAFMLQTWCNSLAIPRK